MSVTANTTIPVVLHTNANIPNQNIVVSLDTRETLQILKINGSIRGDLDRNSSLAKKIQSIPFTKTSHIVTFTEEEREKLFSLIEKEEECLPFITLGRFRELKDLLTPTRLERLGPPALIAKTSTLSVSIPSYKETQQCQVNADAHPMEYTRDPVALRDSVRHSVSPDTSAKRFK